MILSKSSLWSPLASVLAVGLIWSMFITLLVVPVLYVIVKSRMIKPPSAAVAALIAALLLAANPAHAETKRLTLTEAVDLALKGNSALKIARFKVDEKRKKVDSTSADYYPHLSNFSSYLGNSESQLVTVPLPGVGTIPVGGENLTKGSSTFFLNSTVLAQPVTQLLKIHEATGIARSDQKVAEADVKKAENDVTLAVHQLYYGLLVASKQKEAAEAGLKAAEESRREAEKAVLARNLLEVSTIESRTAVLQNKQSLLAANIQISDLNAELNQLLGLPLDTQLELFDPGPSVGPVESRDYFLQAALSGNPEIESAKATVVKAQGGVRAAVNEYIPDVTLFAANTYQDGASFLKHDLGTFGVMMSWDIWDWGKRSAVIGERSAQLSQTRENLHRLNDEVTVEIDKAYRKLENTKSMMDVAREALALQQERLRLISDQLKTSTISYTKYNEAVAALKKAESDELQARLSYEIAIAELNRIAGTFER